MFPRIAVMLGLLIAQSSAVRADGIAALVEVWRVEKYRFTPTVSEAYLKYARVRAMAELEAAKKPLPQDFLAWVDHDPPIAMTVYGARQDAAKVLLMLYSLEQDLGARSSARGTRSSRWPRQWCMPTWGWRPTSARTSRSS